MDIVRLLKDNMLFVGIVVVVVIIAVMMMKKKEKFDDEDDDIEIVDVDEETEGYQNYWDKYYPYWGWGKHQGMRCRNNDNTGCDTSYGYSRAPRPAPKPAPRPRPAPRPAPKPAPRPRPAPKPAPRPRPAPRPAPNPHRSTDYDVGTITSISSDYKRFTYNVNGDTRRYTSRDPRWNWKIGTKVWFRKKWW